MEDNTKYKQITLLHKSMSAIEMFHIQCNVLIFQNM